jgi:hypothetical protein
MTSVVLSGPALRWEDVPHVLARARVIVNLHYFRFKGRDLGSNLIWMDSEDWRSDSGDTTCYCLASSNRNDSSVSFHATGPCDSERLSNSPNPDHSRTRHHLEHMSIYDVAEAKRLRKWCGLIDGSFVEGIIHVKDRLAAPGLIIVRDRYRRMESEEA